MKKIITLLLISLFIPFQAFASAGETDKLAVLHKSAPIEDEFVKSDAFPKVMPSYVKSTEPITDDLIIPYDKDGMTIKLWARKNGEYKKVTIDDELMTPKFLSKVNGISIIKRHNKNRIEDNFAKKHIASDAPKVRVKNQYDFTQQQIPVHLKIIKNLSTRHGLIEGDSILFKTTKEVSLNGVVLPKGTQVIGRVETISESDKMGCPANLVIDNFRVKDNPDICFYGNVSRTGANRSIWVYPLYQAGNIMFYVAGFVFVPIHGGHAKLLTKDTYTVFYETGAKTTASN